MQTAEREQQMAAPPRSLRLGPHLTFGGATMRFGHGEEIFGAGEDAALVYKVVKGAVRLCTFDSEGRRLIEGFYLEGDLFGLHVDKRHRFTAEAVSDCEMFVFPRTALERAAATERDAAFALYTLTADKLRQTRDHLIVLSRKRAADRVVSFLVQMAARAESEVIHLPMSRLDIADYLGLTIETVSRVFSMLERARAITLQSARDIFIHDLASLEALLA